MPAVRSRHSTAFAIALLAATLAPASEAATYVGDWTNTTFGSTGSAVFDVVLTATTYSVSADLGGSVFGLGDPPALLLSGALEGDGSAVLSAVGDPAFGTVAGTVSNTGVIAAAFSALPPPAGFVVASVTVTGTFTALLIDLDYTVLFAGGDPGGVEGTDFALGTVSATVVPVPPSLVLMLSGFMPLAAAWAMRRRRAPAA